MRDTSFINPQIYAPSLREIFEIVDALLACDTIAASAERTQVLGLLGDDEAFVHTIPITNKPKTDVIAIVRTCLAYPRGLARLVEIVAEYEEGSRAFNALEALLCEVFLPGCVPHDRRKALEALVPPALALPPETLRALYAASLHFVGTPPALEEPTLWRALRRLASLPLQAGGLFPYPIVEFAEQLAGYAAAQGQPGVAAAISAWSDAQLPTLPGLDAALEALRQSLRPLAPPAAAAVAAAPAEAPRLLVEVVPSGKRARPLTANAWLWRGSGDGEALAVNAALKNVDALKDWINELLLAADRALLARMNALVIEFLLPRELLCLDVDQWPIQPVGISLGARYRVVVRWRNRNRDLGMLSPWLVKWQSLQALRAGGPRPSAKPPIYWLDKLGDAANFFRSLAVTLDDCGVVCLALPFAPPAEPARGDDVLNTALNVGVPVAVWVREASLAGTARQQIEQFLAEPSLADLPTHALAQRRAAAESGDAAHVGNHLSLLWDDPSRKPPAPSLAAPQTVARQ
jgi:hypothetical protein